MIVSSSQTKLAIELSLTASLSGTRHLRLSPLLTYLPFQVEQGHHRLLLFQQLPLVVFFVRHATFRPSFVRLFSRSDSNPSCIKVLLTSYPYVILFCTSNYEVVSPIRCIFSAVAAVPTELSVFDTLVPSNFRSRYLIKNLKKAFGYTTNSDSAHLPALYMR
jgi:hypothetical protein